MRHEATSSAREATTLATGTAYCCDSTVTALSLVPSCTPEALRSLFIWDKEVEFKSIGLSQWVVTRRSRNARSHFCRTLFSNFTFFFLTRRGPPHLGLSPSARPFHC